jgi:dGTPase
MQQTMQWQRLYSPKRWGKDTVEDEQLARSGYQRDYDRLIFSSPFRRLQNKTQVFPLPGSIFVHNRLTHSLEVASVGRSLGNLVGAAIADKYKDAGEGFDFFYRNQLGNVVASACLAHDIGNPPFGHSGEKAISEYFVQHEQELKGKFTPGQWKDLTNFEGNANAIRILTHQYKGRMEGGFGLTYTTLATIAKYPCESLAGGQKKILHRKKYGYFQSEQATFEKIAAELGMISLEGEHSSYLRHPFVFLVEAADDICYNIIDWEDAHRLHIISYKEAEDALVQFFVGSGEEVKVRATLEQLGDENEKLAYLRAKIISKLIFSCVAIFMNNEAAILAGTYNKSLTDDLSGTTGEAMTYLTDISPKLIYNHNSVLQIELAGYKVLGGLLEEFVPAALEEKPSRYNAKLLQILPQQFSATEGDNYQRVQSIVDFVSNMTDLYAVDLYRKIKGISIPTYGG